MSSSGEGDRSPGRGLAIFSGLVAAFLAPVCLGIRDYLSGYTKRWSRYEGAGGAMAGAFDSLVVFVVAFLLVYRLVRRASLRHRSDIPYRSWWTEGVLVLILTCLLLLANFA